MMQVRSSVKYSPIHGLGCFAEEDIKEGFDVNSMSRHFFKPYLYVVNTINEILYLNIIIEQNKEKLVEKMIYLDDVFYFREVIKYKNNKMFFL
jgi:hypothetical protein